MKIVFEEDEEEKIKNSNQQIRFFSDNEDDVYAIKFRVTDRALANYIIAGLLYGELKDLNLGIEVTEVILGDMI